MLLSSSLSIERSLDQFKMDDDDEMWQRHLDLSPNIPANKPV